MKHFVLLTLFIGAMLTLASSPAMATKGHHSPGSSGILAATMPPPGSYVKLYNTFYSTDNLRDDNGKKARTGLDTDAYILSTRFIHVHDKELFGGNMLSDIVIPVQYMSRPDGTGSRDNNLSLGDTLVQPLYFAWHGERWDAVFGPGIYIPIGSTGAHGAGKGYWSWIISAGATAYFDAAKTWHFSFIARLEDHIKDTATIIPGMDAHIEGGLGKKISPNITVGVAGTAYWQLTEDRGSGSGNLKYRAYAVGPEFRYSTPSRLGIEMRYLFEMDVKNGTQGRTFFLNLTKAF